ncbi:hypothetical protein B4099_0963 [Heyndrickxia coagulans]|uniref:Uncharacterized protein n=1 Tax=Heyndrickxia coagulans TaxID=1398 RepID=A0A150KIV2_HEYCO|nr:hypothetical protein B4099_0963 [Heyndrickxia coagulans]
MYSDIFKVYKIVFLILWFEKKARKFAVFNILYLNFSFFLIFSHVFS